MLPQGQERWLFRNQSRGCDIPHKNLVLQPLRDSREQVPLTQRICAAGQYTVNSHSHHKELWDANENHNAPWLSGDK